jgi:biotin synthase
MQAARWLIVHNWARVEDMAFDTSGHLDQFGVPVSIPGDAFRTSGCPDCNRPFYNEQPSGPMYNFPRPLTEEEAARAIWEMEVKCGC